MTLLKSIYKILYQNALKCLFVFVMLVSCFNMNDLVNAENTEKGTLVISKADESENSIEGYEFGIYYSNSKDGEPFQTVTIDSTGSASIELDVGNYWIGRLNYSDTLLPDGKLSPFTIKANETTEFHYLQETLTGSSRLARATYVTATRKNMGWYCPQFQNFALLYMSGTPVFCIQPHQLFSTADPYEVVYTKPNFISDAELRKISLVIYYGKEFYGNDKWIATAQCLIWYYMGESWSSCIIDFKDGTTNESMMTTLNNMVNTHTTKPSFDGKTLSISPGETITVTDTNGVLERFIVSESINGISITRNENELSITADSTVSKGTYQVNVDNDANIGKGTNTYYTTWGTSIHGSDGWQRCGQIYVASADAVSSTFSLEVKESKGSLTMTKTSSNTTITSGNNCYSLAGAVYGVYSNNACTTKVGELTTKSDGTSNTLELKAGNYWIKEIIAPKNFKLDTTVYSVSVTSGSTTTFKAADVPLSDPVRLLLGKIDKQTNSNKPSGSKSLENAEFTFKFYLGEYADNVDPATLGKTPTKTWVIKTDSDGYCRLGDEYKVSGDSFWVNESGVPTLPFGTLTVQETKAPEGYHLNNELFIVKITSDGSGGIVTYNMPIVSEQAVQFTIEKVQKGTSTKIQGVTFTHTAPNGTKTTYTTDVNGKIILDGLAVGTHTVVETATVDGFKVNTNTFKFKINDDGSITKLKTITSDMGMTYSLDANNNGVLKVENDEAPYKLSVTKVNNHDSVLSDATFTLYSDASCTKALGTKTTDSNGKLTFNDLEIGIKYYLKETKAPTGYRIPVDANGKVHVYEIYAESTPTKNVFNFYVDGTKYTTSSTSGAIHLEGTKDERIISIKVVNEVGMQLPKTGSSSIVMTYGMVSILAYGAFLLSQKSKKKEKNK